MLGKGFIHLPKMWYLDVAGIGYLVDCMQAEVMTVSMKDTSCCD